MLLALVLATTLHISLTSASCLRDQVCTTELAGDTSVPILGATLLQKVVNGAGLLQPPSADEDVGAQPVRITGPELGITCPTLLVEVQGDMGGKYCVPDKIDRPAIAAVKAGKLFEPLTHELMDKELKASHEPGDAVTMGLFFGDFLPHLSRLVGPDQRVWGFEPNPLNYALARATVASNSLKNVWIANAGVGNKTVDALEFCAMKDGKNKGGFGHVGPEKGCTFTRVPIVALDNILPRERRISLIHADVQGEEFNLVKGAVETIRKWKPLVILEQQADTRDAARGGRAEEAQQEDEQQKFMETLGYREGALIEQNRVFRFDESA